MLSWTFLPSEEFAPGERTGKGGDRFLSTRMARAGSGSEDFAIAMVDELECPTHSRRRFMVGY